MSNNNVMEISDESVDAIAAEKNNEENKSTRPQVSIVASTNVASSVIQPSKRRISTHWDHFDKVGDGKVKCKYCTSIICASNKNGTSGMKNHLERCKKNPANLASKKQKLIDFESKSIVDKDRKVHVVNVPKLWQYDQEAARLGLARMIIMDELPFSFVEHEGFREFCKLLNPLFIAPSRRSITRDCYGLFIEEMKKMKIFFSKLSSRVSLTIDTWTSGQNLSYMCLTAHFIDDEWTLHKRILNFCHIAGHSGEFIGKAVEKCLIEWGIKNVMTVTVDNASSNDLVIKYLRRRLNHWGGSVLDGRFLHMRCAAHILNLIVKDGLKDVNASTLRICTAVKYVRSSPARLQKFRSCVEEERLECKGLVCLDVETRWNSTYLMLDCAIKFRLAFNNLLSKGGPYVKEFVKLGGPPTEEDWNIINSFLPFLQIFYDATLRLSGSRYATGNHFVPQLFDVGDLISSHCESVDLGMQNMAGQMKLKMDKYWGNVENVNILPFVAFVLDPRYKMRYLEVVIDEIYDEEKAGIMKTKVQVTMHSLFHIYDVSKVQPKNPSQLGDSSLDQVDKGENNKGLSGSTRLKMKFQQKMGALGTIERKNELDKYLDEEAEPVEGEFDILQWWKDHQKRYPILAMVSRDILAIPTSTVASESAFSTGGRVLDSFRTSLTPRMVEALVCGQDWMRTSCTHFPSEENILELEAMEEGMKKLILEQPLIEIDESISLVEE